MKKIKLEKGVSLTHGASAAVAMSVYYSASFSPGFSSGNAHYKHVLHMHAATNPTNISSILNECYSNDKQKVILLNLVML
jgi:hypothetical protein